MPATSPPGLLAFGPLLTIREVAAELRWSPHTVKRLIRSGDMPAVRLKGRRPWFVRLDDLERYLGNGGAA